MWGVWIDSRGICATLLHHWDQRHRSIDLRSGIYPNVFIVVFVGHMCPFSFLQSASAVEIASLASATEV